MKTFTFDTPVQAWTFLMKSILNGDNGLFDPDQGANITGQSYTYGLTLLINKAEFEPDFNFGRIMGYTQSKWTSLINNYVDLDALDALRLQIRDFEKNKSINRNYHIAFHFADSHNNGKGCLVSGIFSRMINQDNPRLTVVMRASEMVTRLPWDLLLCCRLGEYVYGHTDFSIQVVAASGYADDITLMLYNGYEDVEPIIGKIEDQDRRKRFKKVLKKVRSAAELATDPGYQAYMRVYKVFNPEAYSKELQDLYAKDCIIGDWENIPLPKVCPTILQRNRFKNLWKGYLKKTGLTPEDFGTAVNTRKVVKFNSYNPQDDNLPFGNDFDEPEEQEQEFTEDSNAVETEVVEEKQKKKALKKKVKK